MREIRIIDYGRHDMYEMRMEYKGLTIAGMSLVGVVDRLLKEFVDEDFKKTQAIIEVLQGSKESVKNGNT